MYLRAFWYYSVFKGVLVLYSVFKGVLVLLVHFKGVLVLYSVFKGVLVFFGALLRVLRERLPRCAGRGLRISAPLLRSS